MVRERQEPTSTQGVNAYGLVKGIPKTPLSEAKLQRISHKAFSWEVTLAIATRLLRNMVVILTLATIPNPIVPYISLLRSNIFDIVQQKEHSLTL